MGDAEAALPRAVTRRWWFSAVAVLTVAAGCATAPQFQVSVPREVPDSVKGQISGEIIELNLDALTVGLQLQNFQTEPAGASRPLALWLEIGSAHGSLTLDPRQVTVTSGAGRAQRPLTFLGPAEAWQSPRAVARGCGPRRYAWGWSISKVDVSLDDVQRGNPEKGIRTPAVGPVLVEGKRCFLIWFDTDPSPALLFVVSIRGVSRAGVPVTIPDVHFGSGTVRKTVVP